MTYVKKIKLGVLFVLIGVLITIITVRYQDIKHNTMVQFGSPPMLHVEETDGRTYIVDVTKEKFDITHALSQGYQIEGFEFGIGKDTIAPIMKPDYAKPGDSEFESWAGNNAVLGVVIDNQARAYPIKLLSHHEVVNDQINGVSFAACYCPLADLGAVYKCETSEGEITIGTSGWTYNRTFMLYDHTTDSLWYPYENGLRSIGGVLQGKELSLIGSEKTSWEQWRSKYPNTWLCIGGTTPHQTDTKPPETSSNPVINEDNTENVPVGSGTMR